MRFARTASPSAPLPVIEHPRFLPAGERAVLIELASTRAVIALFDTLRAAALPGIEDLVPAARTLLVRFDPDRLDRAALRRLVARPHAAARETSGRTLEIPVTYDGPDLTEVADALGWPVARLIRRHRAAEFTVAFVGFSPGFAYLVADDTELRASRRASPRLRIPAGSVAMAGEFSGVYPRESPGGWQLIGRTSIAMWRTERTPPALLAPGDRVHFADEARTRMPPAGPDATPMTQETPAAPAIVATRRPGLRVIRADRPALFQDAGRMGQAIQGVTRSGALDINGLRAANAHVGNPETTPALEIAHGGFGLRAEIPATLAAAGAPAPLLLRPAGGDEPRQLRHAAPFALDPGDELTLGAPLSGSRTYLALRGGFAVTPLLSSAATDTLAALGPRPVDVGAVLLPAHGHARAVRLNIPQPPLPRAGDVVHVGIRAGPRADWFDAVAWQVLTRDEFRVTPQSDRIAMRLAGTRPIPRREGGELLSEGIVPGAIEIPHDGRPILFLADHPLSGGYPVMAIVAGHDMMRVAQAPIGARLRFHLIGGPRPAMWTQ